VIGADLVGNWQSEASATRATWTVDTTGPVAVLTGAPTGAVSATSAEVTVSGANVTTYRWRLGTGAYSASVDVATPIVLQDLPDGPVSLQVLGADAIGNVQASPSQATWTVDTVPPVAALSGVPSGTVASDTATLTVGGGGVVSYRYRVDGGALSAEAVVAAPIVLSGLTDGPHSVEVIGADEAGNWQPADQPTTGSWTVDTTPPVTTLAGAPQGTVGTDHAEITVGGAGVVRYRYEVDSGAWSAEAPVSAPIDLTGLADGAVTLAVIGADAVGNWQAATDATQATWVVDTTAPEAVLSGAPRGVVSTTSTRIEVSGTGVATYAWRLAGGTWSDRVDVATAILLSGLQDGPVTLEVLGADAVGNLQATPTVASWTVDTQPPVATVSGAPSGTVAGNGATLTVGGTDVVSYRYRVDGGALSAGLDVATPIELSGLADGPHFVDVIGADEAGNWQDAAHPTRVSWTVDTTPPVAALSGVPQGTTSADHAEITVGGTGVVAYAWQLDGGAWSAQTPVSTPIALTGLADGRVDLAVVGIDAVGNRQAEADATRVDWVVDTTGPVAVLTGAPIGSVSSTSAQITVSGDGVVGYRWRLAGGSYSASIDVGTPISLSRLPDGPVTLEVIGSDASGNFQATPTAVSWTVDTQPPVASLSGAPTGTVNRDSATLTVGGTDLVSYRYALDGGAMSVETSVSTPIVLAGLADGPHTVEVIGVDEAGSWQPRDQATRADWIVDTTPPVAELVRAPQGTVRSDSAEIGVQGTGVVAYEYRVNGASWSAEIPVATHITLSGLVDGVVTLEVVGVDAVGNWQPEAEATVAEWKVDTTAPTAVLSGAPTGTVTSTSATVTVAGAGVASYQWRLAGGAYSGPVDPATPIELANLPDGPVTLEVIATDAAGNVQATPTTATWTVDTQAPVATIVGAPTGTVSLDNATLTVGGTDVVAYRYALDGGAMSVETAVSTPIVLSSLADGPHDVDVIGVDQAGNWQSASQPTSVRWTVDITPPVAVLSRVPTGTVRSDFAEIGVQGTDVVAYEYRVNGAKWSAETPVTTHITLTGLVDGPVVLEVIGVDATGNWQPEAEATTGQWTVDTTAPTAVLDAPTGAVNSTSATVTVSGADVATYVWRLAGDAWSASTDVATPIELTGLPQGSVTLEVTATDAAGNVQPTPTVASWTVDTIKPVASVTGAPTGTVATTSATLVVGGPDVAMYSYKANNGYWVAPTPVGTPIELTGLPEGTNTVLVIGKDAAGNWQSSAFATKVSWVIDLTGPDTVVTGVPAFPISVGDVTLDVDATDVDHFDYQVQADRGAIVAQGTGLDPTGTDDIVLTGLTEDGYTVTVTGYDAVGNADPTPFVGRWFVDQTPPVVHLTPGEAVLAGETLRLHFSEVVMPSATLSGTLLDPGYTSTWSGDHRDLTLTPDKVWFGGDLTVTGVDAAGNPFSATFDVTVRDGAVYVDDATGDDGNDGSKANPFKTLQAGIAAAQPGEVVRVAAGEYRSDTAGGAPIALADDVWVFCGFRTGFDLHDPSAYETSLTDVGPDSTGASLRCGASVTAATRVDRIVAHGGDRGGKAYYAFLAKNGCAAELSHVKILVDQVDAARTGYGARIDMSNVLVRDSLLDGEADASIVTVTVAGGGAPTFRDDEIRGGLGAPETTAIEVFDGQVSLDGDTISGGYGSMGGRNRTGCPVSADGSSIAVHDRGGIVSFTNDVIYGRDPGEPARGVCGIDGTATRTAVWMERGSGSVRDSRLDALDALLPAGSSCPRSVSTALRLDTSDVWVQRNTLVGGTGCGQGVTYGLDIGEVSPLVENNLVFSGDDKESIGLSLEWGSNASTDPLGARIYNNTIVTLDRAMVWRPLDERTNGHPDVVNNLVYSPGALLAIEQIGAGEPLDVYRNSFAGFKQIWCEGSTCAEAVSDLDSTVPNATGNLDLEPVFSWLEGADGILGTADDDWHLHGRTPCGLREGGEATTPHRVMLGLLDDRDGNPRTADLVCDPGYGVGWSIGAYEY